MAKRPNASARAPSSWVGGVVDLPVSIADTAEPVLALWLELQSGIVLASEIGPRRESPELFQRSLQAALTRPMAGPVRRPSQVRVAHRELAIQAERVLGTAARIVVSDTPELHELAASFVSHVAATERVTYLGDETIAAHLVRELHELAARVAAQTPWQRFSERHVLRLDVPALGLQGGALVVVGRAGQARALLLFPSARDLTLYEAQAVLLHSEPEASLDDFGSPILSLSFEAATELGAAVTARLERDGLRLLDHDHVPVLEHRDSSGEPQVIEERDVRIAIACLTVLSRALAAHPAPRSSFRESLQLEGLGSVTLSLPHEDYERVQEGLRATAEATRRVGRNEPCPCGSGKKSKRCCGSPVALAPPARSAPELRGHDLDRQLVTKLDAFAERELGGRHHGLDALFAEPEQAMQLLVPLRLFSYPVDGRPVAAHYLQRYAPSLSSRELEWLSLQLGASLSVWEVLEVEPGSSMVVRDAVRGGDLSVMERSGTTGLRRHEMLLARVIEYEDTALMVGCYPRTLMPSEAAAVVEAVRRVVPGRGPKRELPEPLLAKAWEQMVQAVDAARKNPELRNTDGHRLIITRDHFDLAPGQRAAVESRVRKLLWCDEPEPQDDGSVLYPFVRVDKRKNAPLPSTLIGRVTVSEERVTIETNSSERADVLRARLEGISGELVRHRLREHEDPLSSAREYAPVRAPEPLPAELQELLQSEQSRLMRGWLDEKLPALKGKSPRQAVKSKIGRSRVELLLRDMELTHARAGDDHAPIFRQLREELGLA